MISTPCDYAVTMKHAFTMCYYFACTVGWCYWSTWSHLGWPLGAYMVFMGSEMVTTCRALSLSHGALFTRHSSSFAALQTDGCTAGIHDETSYAENAVRQRTSTGWIACKHESATNMRYNSILIWSWHGVLINNLYSDLARSPTLDRMEEAAGSHWPDFISCHTPYALSPTAALQDDCPYKWMNI